MQFFFTSKISMIFLWHNIIPSEEDKNFSKSILVVEQKRAMEEYCQNIANFHKIVPFIVLLIIFYYSVRILFIKFLFFCKKHLSAIEEIFYKKSMVAFYYSQFLKEGSKENAYSQNLINELLLNENSYEEICNNLKKEYFVLCIVTIIGDISILGYIFALWKTIKDIETGINNHEIINFYHDWLPTTSYITRFTIKFSYEFITIQILIFTIIFITPFSQAFSLGYYTKIFLGMEIIDFLFLWLASIMGNMVILVLFDMAIETFLKPIIDNELLL